MHLFCISLKTKWKGNNYCNYLWCPVLSPENKSIPNYYPGNNLICYCFSMAHWRLWALLIFTPERRNILDASNLDATMLTMSSHALTLALTSTTRLPLLRLFALPIEFAKEIRTNTRKIVRTWTTRCQRITRRLPSQSCQPLQSPWDTGGMSKIQSQDPTQSRSTPMHPIANRFNSFTLIPKLEKKNTIEKLLNFHKK